MSELLDFKANESLLSNQFLTLFFSQGGQISKKQVTSYGELLGKGNSTFSKISWKMSVRHEPSLKEFWRNAIEVEKL
jgi:hypothetical protein